MFEFGEKHPVVFEIILFLVAYLIAGIIVGLLSVFNPAATLSTFVSRVFVGIVLCIVYRRAFQDNEFFPRPIYLVPALLFPLWNLFYNLSAGAQLGNKIFFMEAVLLGFAPAFFEEVIFRGIFIYNLKKKGHSDMECLFISAAIFAAAHLTNFASGNYLAAAIQVGYSFVFGLVMAAIYLKNHSIIQVILIHFLTDYMNHIYLTPAGNASTFQIILFIILLVAEACYGIWLVAKAE